MKTKASRAKPLPERLKPFRGVLADFARDLIAEANRRNLPRNALARRIVYSPEFGEHEVLRELSPYSVELLLHHIDREKIQRVSRSQFWIPLSEEKKRKMVAEWRAAKQGNGKQSLAAFARKHGHTHGTVRKVLRDAGVY